MMDRIEFIKAHLWTGGRVITNEQAHELSDAYEDCQEWDDGEMLTGNTEAELEDFLDYSPCVGEVMLIVK